MSDEFFFKHETLMSSCTFFLHQAESAAIQSPLLLKHLTTQAH